MLSTLLATKLHRPRPTSSPVARPRLTDRLDAGLRNGHRLFLVVPPRAMASCGTSKTMILE
jgi:ATP/maltotriose-dependent transcriptional regulator MalT